MNRWAFTFGQGYNLKNNYVVVEADTEQQARTVFVAARAAAGELPDSGQRWAFSYVFDVDFEEQIRRYGLTEVPITTPIKFDDDRPLIKDFDDVGA